MGLKLRRISWGREPTVNQLRGTLKDIARYYAARRVSTDVYWNNANFMSVTNSFCIFKIYACLIFSKIYNPNYIDLYVKYN